MEAIHIIATTWSYNMVVRTWLEVRTVLWSAVPYYKPWTSCINNNTWQLCCKPLGLAAPSWFTSSCIWGSNHHSDHSGHIHCCGLLCGNHTTCSGVCVVWFIVIAGLLCTVCVLIVLHWQSHCVQRNMFCYVTPRCEQYRISGFNLRGDTGGKPPTPSMWHHRILKIAYTHPAKFYFAPSRTCVYIKPWISLSTGSVWRYCT